MCTSLTSKDFCKNDGEYNIEQGTENDDAPPRK